MKIIDYITISFSNLGRQKLRTFLTIFSIVIGATLISLVYAVIPGIQNFLDLQLNTLTSPRLIQIYPTEERPGGQIFGSLTGGPEEYTEGQSAGFEFSNEQFTDEDIEKVNAIDGVQRAFVPPYPSVNYVKLEENQKKLSTSFVFYYPKFILENFDLVAGNYYEETDTGKAVVAYEYAEAFGYEDPNELIGKKIVFNIEKSQNVPAASGSIGDMQGLEGAIPETEDKNFTLEIIGVAEKTILSSVIFITYDDAFEMTEFQKGEGGETFALGRFESWVEIEDADRADEIAQKIEELGFTAMTFEESKNVLNDIFGVLTAVFSSFGILAMAVSSLGILNTLVMAVYERTREIGVMKAIGATKKNIAILFTIEAAMIGFFGGLIGVVLGYTLAELLNYIGHKTILSSFETLDIANISPLLLLGLGISTVVATVAGIYPALRAANLNPIKALRYE